MDDQIVCPHCKKVIPLTQALSHQIREKYLKVLDEEKKKQAAEYSQKLQELQSSLEKEVGERLKKQMQKQMEMQILDTKNESEELKKQNSLFQSQILETNKLVRQLRVQDETRKIEMEKKIAEEEEKIKDVTRKQVEEVYRFKILEMEKKQQDAIKLAEEYKRKLEQGSQQMQGEVLELEIENMLRREFPYDEISEVPKGVQGADLIHIVKNNYGKEAGTIIWEFKRTKTWSNEWVSKLKDDQRKVRAEVAVLITQALPQNIKYFGLHEGIWVGDYQSIIGICHALRSQLIQIAIVKSAVTGNNEKKDILWDYLTSTQFSQRLEAMAEVYNSVREDLEKEKRFFKNKWAKQDMNIQKVVDNIYEMHGELESIMGKALVGVKGTDTLPEKIPETKVEAAPTQTESLFKVKI